MHGGPIVGFLGAATPLFGFLIAILAGSAVTATLAIVLKSMRKRPAVSPAAVPATV